MKIFVDKGSGFKLTGRTGQPEEVQKLKRRFPGNIDASGDLIFCEDDLSTYYNDLIPFLKKISNNPK
jgi:hypothetical protein